MYRVSPFLLVCVLIYVRVMSDLFKGTFCLLVDLAAFSLAFALYKESLHVLHLLQNAPQLEINGELASRVPWGCDFTVPYAIVRGTVKAKKSLLESEHVPYIIDGGVIRENVTGEVRSRWNFVSREWLDEYPQILRAVDFVAFKLVGCGRYPGSKGVEISEPLSATALPLQKVYGRITPNEKVGFWSKLADWWRGEQFKGTYEFENMLREGTEITAIGELTLVKDELVLRPPSDHHLPYILTRLSHDESLRKYIQKYSDDVKTLKSWCVLLGGCGMCIGLWVFYKWIAKCRNEQDLQALLRNEEEQRKALLSQKEERRKAFTRSQVKGNRAGSNPGHSSESTCVVCITDPVKIVLLDCGHACLCTECARRIDNCPLCRKDITSKVPFYLP